MPPPLATPDGVLVFDALDSEALAHSEREGDCRRHTFYLGDNAIQVLYFDAAHTKDDSILFVPQDRIVYMSEVFFNDEFPNMARGWCLVDLAVAPRHAGKHERAQPRS